MTAAVVGLERLGVVLQLVAAAVLLFVLAVAGAFLQLLDVGGDVRRPWAVNLVGTAVGSALALVAPAQHQPLAVDTQAGVVPAPGALGRARRAAVERTAATDVVAEVVGRLRGVSVL